MPLEMLPVAALLDTDAALFAPRGGHDPKGGGGGVIIANLMACMNMVDGAGAHLQATGCRSCRSGNPRQPGGGGAGIDAVFAYQQ